MKHQLILSGLFLLAFSTVGAQNYFDDDIYYNPKKDDNKIIASKAKKQSNYIANMADMDVDTYNRRDQYYMTPIDTIGRGVENGEDFVYTQQIQKYYNPTIVVDNADILGDVLANAYGNVEIVINDNGLPVFTPYYAYGWPYYSRWGYNWGGWGWNVSFYDPWYSWNWGWSPSWAWGPSWSWGPSWGWGPAWAWGPSWGWGPGWGAYPPMASWRPNGNRPVAPSPGWSDNHRPGIGGGNAGLAHGGFGNSGSGSVRPGNSSFNNHRPVSGSNNIGSGSTRPVSGSSTGNPGHAGVVNNNGKWQYINGGHRVPLGTVNNGAGNNSSSRPGNYVPNNNNNSNRGNSTVNSNRNNSSNRNNYNTSNRNTNTTRSYNTGRSGSTNRGGSFGGGYSTGGTRSGGGRHR